jgi:hypothetical protein
MLPLSPTRSSVPQDELDSDVDAMVETAIRVHGWVQSQLRGLAIDRGSQGIMRSSLP